MPKTYQPYIIALGALAIVAVGTVVFLTRPAPMPAQNVPAQNAPAQEGEDRSADASTNAEMLDTTPQVPVDGEEVEYAPGIRGYFVRPEEGEGHPGIVVVHEWWGLNDHIRQMADLLAGEGYAVLAVDLHGKVAATPDEARALTGALDQKKAIANMQAATAYLRERGARRIGALGWCFGGGQVMQFALSGEQLDATVIYYGQLVTDPMKLRAISWPLLGIFGDKDTAVKPESVQAFEAALAEAGVDHEIHMYPGVGHAFANPSGQNYAPEATKDAWEKTRAFLRDALEPPVTVVP